MLLLLLLSSSSSLSLYIQGGLLTGYKRPRRSLRGGAVRSGHRVQHVGRTNNPIEQNPTPSVISP